MLYTSGFVDDVIFSHNRANGSESKTTRIFPPVCQVAASGAKSAMPDCILYDDEFARFAAVVSKCHCILNRSRTTYLVENRYSSPCLGPWKMEISRDLWCDETTP